MASDGRTTLADITDVPEGGYRGVRRTDRGLRPRLSERGRRARIAEQTDLEQQDIEGTVKNRDTGEQEVRLTKDARAERIAEQTQLDRDDIESVTRDQEGNLRPELTAEGRAEQLARQTDLDRQDIASVRRTDSGLEPRLTQQGRIEQVAEQTDLAADEIATVQRTASGLVPVLTEDERTERVADELGVSKQNIASIDDNDVELTDAGRRELAEDLSQEERIDRVAEANPELDPGDIESVDVTESGQLQPEIDRFDASGIAVSPEPNTPDEGNSITSTTRVLPEPTTPDITGGLLDIGGTARQAASPVVGTFEGVEETVADTPVGTLGAGIADVGGDVLEDIDETVGDPIRQFGGRTAEGSAVVADRLGDFAGPRAENAGEAIGDVFGVGDQLGGVSRGVANVGTELFRLPATAASVTATTEEAAEFTAGEIKDGGVVEGVEESVATGAAVGTTTAGAATAAAVEGAKRRPFRTAGAVAAGIVTGSLAARGLEKGATALRYRRQIDSELDSRFEDITSERGAQGDLPQFETSPSAPTPRAVREVRERAADQPDDVLERVSGGSVVFRSETERLPADFDVGEGQSELPGTFVSPDASPLRTSLSGESSASFSLRLPRLRAEPERLSAFDDPDIEGMPRSAAGSGRIPDGDGGWQPDPETAGAQFLRDQEGNPTAFVRPTGDRTTELEAVIPPGARFRRTETAGIDVEGNRGTLDFYEPLDDVADDTVSARPRGSRADDAVDEDVVTTREIESRASSRRTTPDDSPITPSPTTGGTPTTATSTAPTTSATSTRPRSSPTDYVSSPTTTAGASTLTEPGSSIGSTSATSTSVPGTSSVTTPGSETTSVPGGSSSTTTSTGVPSGSTPTGTVPISGIPTGDTPTTPPPPPDIPDIPDADSEPEEEYIGEFDETQTNPIAKLGTPIGGDPPWL